MVINPHEFTDHKCSLSRKSGVGDALFFLDDSTILYYSKDYNFLNFLLLAFLLYHSHIFMYLHTTTTYNDHNETPSASCHKNRHPRTLHKRLPWQDCARLYKFTNYFSALLFNRLKLGQNINAMSGRTGY